MTLKWKHVCFIGIFVVFLTLCHIPLKCWVDGQMLTSASLVSAAVDMDASWTRSGSWASK